MAMKTQGRLAEIEAVLKTLGQSRPAEVDAFRNFMSKSESGSEPTAREKEVINAALSVAAQRECCEPSTGRTRSTRRSGATI